MVILGIIICILLFSVGCLMQVYSKINKLNFVGIWLSFILPVLIGNNTIMNFLIEKTKLNDVMIIIAVLSYAAGTSISFVIFKVSKIDRMERNLEYANKLIADDIYQNLKAIKKELDKHPNLFSKDIYITLYIVKRRFFNRITQMCKIGDIGMPSILNIGWNGAIKKYKKSSFYDAIKDKIYGIVNYKEIDEEDFDGIPESILNWLIKNVTFRINAPIIRKKDVVFILSIVSIDSEFDWYSLPQQIKDQQTVIAESIIKNYEPSINSVYSYYHNIS